MTSQIQEHQFAAERRWTTAAATVRQQLLAARLPSGHWEGELSASALATATAISTFCFYLQQQRGRPEAPADDPLQTMIEDGIRWLLEQQNDDGGWGDTPYNYSNISTTMLVVAAIHAAGRADELSAEIEAANAYIQKQGGIAGLRRRYGKDKTFAVPILANCAMAGIVPWSEVAALPFEAACVPQRCYNWLQLPVVSYAIPALVAIGQVKFHFAPPWDPLRRLIRRFSVQPGLRVLQKMQPASGGYLEAIPLTSFVCMALCKTGKSDHPVVQNGIRFLAESFRAEEAESDLSGPCNGPHPNSPPHPSPLPKGEGASNTRLPKGEGASNTRLPKGEGVSEQPLPTGEAPPISPLSLWERVRVRESELEGSIGDTGSWPIDTNLATWNTSLAINALANNPTNLRQRLNEDPETWQRCLEWLLACQTTTIHPFTGAGPGGWGWSDLSGAVPDADDTPGTLLALKHVSKSGCEWLDDSWQRKIERAASIGVRWLLGLQNRDGGWPTFCKGWGKLPFDRSGADITAHVIRGLLAWQENHDGKFRQRISRAVAKGFLYLEKQQRPDGSWLPLWFGNQDQPDDENPFYGTAKVMLAYRDAGKLETLAARRGFDWLAKHQYQEGSWGGGPWLDSVPDLHDRWDVTELGHGSIEETALCVEALLSSPYVAHQTVAAAGLDWLSTVVEHQKNTVCSPIGFYFAKLWYYERLYPLIFASSALERALRSAGSLVDNENL